MKYLIIAMLFQTGTLTFVGQIIASQGPTSTQIQTADNSTVSNTPLLSYYSTYVKGPVKVETVTYE